MKKLSSLILILAFLLSGCYATISPSPVRVVEKPAYVYYDNLHGTRIYLPYRISSTPRYRYVRYIRNYRGKYRTYTRYYLNGQKRVRKVPSRTKRHPPAMKKHKKKQKKKKFRKH